MTRNEVRTGTLYIVGTPIGNLEEMTPRAVRLLHYVDLIAAEDTRHSRVLLSHFGIKTPMFSCHKFNEGKRGDFFVSALLEGKNVALISDAGTPCISDPGYRLVSLASEAGVPVVPVSGASAVIAGLSVSGFDISRFTFIGFLPKGGDALKMLDESASCGVVVFFESPRRAKATLELMVNTYPDARVCLCNDLTKKFERIYRGAPAEVLDELRENPDAEKGEYTFIMRMPDTAPADETAEQDEQSESIESRLVDIMVKNGCTLKTAAQKLKETTEELSKKQIYAAMINIKNMFAPEEDE